MCICILVCRLFYTTLEKERERSFIETTEGSLVDNDYLNLYVCKTPDGNGWVIEISSFLNKFVGEKKN